MQKFIHDSFLLDLTSYQIDRVEENQWFSDDFFTKYTFPFELYITDEINRYFGGILDFNMETRVTVYNGYFFIDGIHEEATLEIKDVKGRIASIEISYGLDEFPNWDTQLSELPLQKQELGQSLFEHAETVISKSYPDVNYNFVQVHTDSFSSEDDGWLGFEGIINNRVNGAFLLNEFDEDEDLTYNRNVMIPFPYLMHVLVTGFEAAGYELTGDVLTDPDLLKMVFVKESEEYINARIEGEEFLVDIADFDSVDVVRFNYSVLRFDTPVGSYTDQYAFAQRGRYKISGNVYLRRLESEATANIYYDGKLIKSFKEELSDAYYKERVRTVDININVDDISKPVVFTSRQLNWRQSLDITVNEGSLWDLTITPLAIYDEVGELVPALITTEKLDLTQCVPDKSFGDLVKMVKNWKNMDFKIDGNIVSMNYIQPQLNVSDAIDFNEFNLKEPRRSFGQGENYLLQFIEVDNDDYTRGQLLVDIDGVQTSDIETDDFTNEIDIDVVPLPLVFRGDVTTALAVNDGKSDFCIAIYEGTTGVNNVAQDNTSILLPAIYADQWSVWLEFRLRSQGFTTQFNIHKQRIFGLTTYNKIFMYNNFHLIKSINKVNLPGKDIFQVELELESLK